MDFETIDGFSSDEIDEIYESENILEAGFNGTYWYAGCVAARWYSSYGSCATTHPQASYGSWFTMYCAGWNIPEGYGSWYCVVDYTYRGHCAHWDGADGYRCFDCVDCR